VKKSLITGIVVGIIIFSIVLFLLIYAHKETEDNIKLVAVCEDYNTSEECSFSLECQWKSNESKCVLINITDDEEEINTKLEDTDPNNLSNSICNNLPTSSEFGLEDVYYCLAVVNHNSTFCEKIGNDINESNNLEESDISENPDDLNDDTPKNICLAISTEDSSYCKKITRLDAKKTCYNVLAQTSGNIDFCSNIEYNENEKQQCYFSFVNALYWEDKSEEITTEDCDKVSINGNDQDKNTCLAFKARDVSFCGSNKNCLTFFPQKISFCDGVTFKDEEECIRDRAMVNEDLSICDTLSDQTRRDDCYGDFSSHIQPNITICDKIIGLERKRGCYIDAAINFAK
jgi:hypothetical protein